MDQALIMSILDGIEQLLIDSSNLGKIREAATQIAGESAPLNKRHNEIENAIGIAKFDQRQDMRVVKSSHSASFAGKAAAHVAVSRVIAKNDLNSHAPPEGSTLLAFIDSTHA